jgi:hypothetical protein
VVAKLTFRAEVARVGAQRDQLDIARARALELIFDKEKYFYPYRPPAVTVARAAEYAPVQVEVERRVAEVRRIWTDRRRTCKVPAAAREHVERLEWVIGALRDLGELDAAEVGEVAWLLAQPAGRVLSVADYCRTLEERAELDAWERIEAFNAAAPVGDGDERAQLAITNEYRRMFGRCPLAGNGKLHAAARGHAVEMEALHYFSHTSPTAGRRTPFDRMFAAGYRYGAAENIAIGSGAQSAHHSWVGSSEHHRAILSTRFTELGVAASGTRWVQNFGGGREYETDPRWK